MTVEKISSIVQKHGIDAVISPANIKTVQEQPQCLALSLNGEVLEIYNTAEDIEKCLTKLALSSVISELDFFFDH